MSEQGQPEGRRRPSHATVVAYLALFVALGGTAWAAAEIGSKDIKRNAVKAKHIRSDAVGAKELAEDSVSSENVGEDALTGDDIAEATLQNVDATTLGGKQPAAYLTSSLYFRSSPISAGNLLANGRFSQTVSCDPGDVAISGGPDRVSAPSLLASSTGAFGGWSVTIDKMGGTTDTFAATVICLDQAP